MEKIVLAINGSRINTATIDFACYIASLTKSKLTALFLKDNLFELIPPRSSNEKNFKFHFYSALGLWL